MDLNDSSTRSNSNQNIHNYFPTLVVEDASARDALARQISQPLTELLTGFIRQELVVEPTFRDLKHIWECSWEEGAGELCVFLQKDNTQQEFYLKLYYLWKDHQSPIRSFRPSDIDRLSQLVQERIGIHVIACT